MQLASHELHELSELIASCFNTVTCMGTFINQAQDPNLKSLLQKHYPKHIEDYNLKVEFVQNATTPDISKFQPDTLTPKLNNYTQTPTNLAQATAPRTNAETHNDREIATAYLLNQKAAAKNYAASVLECANPTLRTFLENAFLNSSRHSYEIWEYMMEKGYYPLSPATNEAIQAVGGMYQTVQQFPYMGDSSTMPQQQHLQ
ncbi:spore coat protein [Lederbergia wuyishanensis]|uniref:Spore coat protein CotF n=1 Tax=Lederbergia wuyishanensis TaxID=1347903 RepID=A0ABU0D9B3_9BACI|nr:spore coat protein [Lederbergia wuyishanensis]MCJ8009387.1 spore coat protein [Lederbergia wuyishanensis]MDQ0345004.1 spore coat protein CotF [Lederbergia wuyishanensis]